MFLEIFNKLPFAELAVWLKSTGEKSEYCSDGDWVIRFTRGLHTHGVISLMSGNTEPGVVITYLMPDRRSLVIRKLGNTVTRELRDPKEPRPRKDRNPRCFACADSGYLPRSRRACFCEAGDLANARIRIARTIPR